MSPGFTPFRPDAQAWKCYGWRIGAICDIDRYGIGIVVWLGWWGLRFGIGRDDADE